MNQTDLINKNKNNIPPYRIFINAFQLDKFPDGFSDNLNLERNKKYKGIFKRYADVELTFYKDAGYSELKTLYENDGVDANAFITIQYLDVNTGTYKDRYVGQFDFLTYEEIEGESISGQVIERGFIEKILNRSKQKINLLNNTSIDGDSITGINQTDLTLPEQNIKNVGNWVASGITSYVSNPTNETLRVDLDLLSSNIGGAVTAESSNNNLFIDSFTITAKAGCVAEMEGEVDTVNESLSMTGTYTVRLNDSSFVTGSLTIVKNSALNWSWSFSTGIPTFIPQNTNPGDTMRVELRFVFPSGVDPFFSLNDGYLRLFQYENPLGEIDIKSYQVYECFLMACQRITGESNPFKSDFFGRTDTPLTIYASDGELIDIVLGRQIRGDLVNAFLS